MRRVRALGIAPYDGLAIQLRNEARKRSDIDIDVYDAIYQKPIDVKLLEKIAKNHETIIIHDAYSTRIGLVDEIIYQLSKLPYKNKIRPFFISLYVKDRTLHEYCQYNIYY